MTVDKFITSILGIPANIKGYTLIRSFLESNNGMEPAKVIYLDLAQKYNSSYTRIERSIRHAIGISWGLMIDNTKRELFGVSIKDGGYPVNLQYLRTIYIAFHNRIDEMEALIA